MISGETEAKGTMQARMWRSEAAGIIQRMASIV